jgi:hypothetical protein
VVASRTPGAGLTHARTRLVAWLCDASGREIAGSRSESRCCEAGDAWQILSLEIHGRFAHAADLVLELQLVQPRHQTAAHPDDVPHPEDVSGQAWFDDVVISHMPRVSMAMRSGVHVVRLGEPADFEVQVNEVAAQDLSARLRVFDLDGRAIFDQQFAAPRGRQTASVQALASACGWYRAVLDISSVQNVSRRRWVDFVVVPAKQRHVAGAHNPFGIVAGGLREQASPSTLELVRSLDPGLVVVPAWDEHTTIENVAAQVSIRRAFVDQLLREGIDVQFLLAGIPAELTRVAGQHARTVIDVFAADGRAWQPYLDEMLLQYGLTIGGWQIGSGDDLVGPSRADSPDFPGTLQRAGAALADYAPRSGAARGLAGAAGAD